MRTSQGEPVKAVATKCVPSSFHFFFLELVFSFFDLINMSSSSSDEEELLLLFALSQAKRKRKWVHEINEKREEFGEFHRLCCELSSFEDRFFTYFRMSKEQFENLHTLLEPKISKQTTNWRKPIGTKERLAICLR